MITDSQLHVEYEISNPITDEVFVSDSRVEAVSYFEAGWYIVEKHITVCVASDYVSTYSETSITWNNNPDFTEN